MSRSVRSAVAAVGAFSFALAACGGAPSSDAGPVDVEPLSLVEETDSDTGVTDTGSDDAGTDDAGTDETAPGQSDDAGTTAQPTVELTSPAGLAAVCSGTTFSNLAPAIDQPRKIAFVESYRNADGTFAVAGDVSVGDPRFDYVESDLLNLDYVGCIVEVSRDRSDLDCALTDADGAPVALDVHELNLALRIVDAATGAEVAVEPIAATMDECPTELPAERDILAPVEPAGLLLAVESHLAR